jgi:hypothetical protein
MYTWAVLAAKEAAVASGLGAGIVPAVGAGSLDGFAIGALLSGTCILMLTSPRHGPRRGLESAAPGRDLGSASRRGLESAGRRRDSESAAGGRVLAAAHGSDTDGTDDEPQIARETQVPDDTGQAAGERQDHSAGGGYRSRHRLPDQNESPKWPGPRRSTPRHAAPSASFSARMTGRIGVRPLATGAHS